MDANDALPECEIDGCRVHVLCDEDDPIKRCVAHGGDPLFAFEDDEFGLHWEWRRPDSR